MNITKTNHTFGAPLLNQIYVN